MSEISELNEKLEKILNKLSEVQQVNEQLKDHVETFAITEMSEKQGFDKNFTYYTLDGEYVTHRPHVHICVPNANKAWEGKPLRSGSPLKTVASVRLDKVEGYTPENLVFEEIKDKKVEGMRYKKAICDWLNSNFTGKRKVSETNAVRCLNSYLMNNEEGYFNLEAEKLLDEYEDNNDGKE